MSQESSDVFRFDPGPLLQGKTRQPNLKVPTTYLLLKNAVYLPNHASCPFTVDTSCIWLQMCPWFSSNLGHTCIWR